MQTILIAVLVGSLVHYAAWPVLPAAQASSPSSHLIQAATPDTPAFLDCLLSADRLAPGEFDLLSRFTPDSEQYNAFWWAPIFRGGFGVVDPNAGSDVWYGGGYLRPLEDDPKYGDLVLGGLAVSSPSHDAGEFQGEYRLPCGLGAGGGLARQEGVAPDINFGKLSFQRPLGEGTILVEALLTDFGDGTNGGAYATIYNDRLFAAGGYDGEQCRLTGAVVFPEKHARFRPALEVIWADTSIGRIDGQRVVFINGSLGYTGGFLSNSARLGRAMGPTGIQYGNPIGFLDPSWNRRFDPWEIGSLVNLRYEWLDLPSGNVFQRFEVVAFPLQLFGHGSLLDGIFLGPTYLDDTAQNGAGVVWGYSRKLGQSVVSIGVDSWLATGTTSVTAGLRLLY